MNFRYKALPWNVIFGIGALSRLPEELGKLGYSRALVLTTPNQAEIGQEIVDLLGDKAGGSVRPGRYARARRNCRTGDGGSKNALTPTVPSPSAAARPPDWARPWPSTWIYPILFYPPGYAGSEMTNLWGVTKDNRKITSRDNVVVPTLTLYDPTLTLTMPAAFAGASGLNAMAQAVVNVVAKDINPIISVMALEAIRALSHSLPIVVSDPDNMDARTEAMYGACLAGGALGVGTTGLHHRLCHTFGGTFNTPHAETHTILLPHSVAYNAGARPSETRRIAESMGVDDAATGLFELAGTIGVPTALKDIGVVETDLDEGRRRVTVETPVNNPAPVTRERVRALLENAYHGYPPRPV